MGIEIFGHSTGVSERSQNKLYLRIHGRGEQRNVVFIDCIWHTTQFRPLHFFSNGKITNLLLLNFPTLYFPTEIFRRWNQQNYNRGHPHFYDQLRSHLSVHCCGSGGILILQTHSGESAGFCSFIFVEFCRSTSEGEDQGSQFWNCQTKFTFYLA